VCLTAPEPAALGAVFVKEVPDGVDDKWRIKEKIGIWRDEKDT
jgi:hypothetical protein